MKQMLKILCENNNSTLEVKESTSLLEILAQNTISNCSGAIAAYVNNKFRDLNYRLYSNSSVKFIDTSHFEGTRVYQRTLRLMLFRAAKQLFPTATLKIKHTILHGFYFELEGVKSSEEVATLLKKEIKNIADQKLDITSQKLHYSEAIELYRAAGSNDKVELLESIHQLYVSVTSLNQSYGSLHGVMAHNSSVITQFEIKPFYDGFYLCPPKRYKSANSQNSSCNSKIFNIMEQQIQLQKAIDVPNVAAMNRLIEQGKGGELIKIGETLQERNFIELANRVKQKVENGVKLLLIAGPSSSGKTTFSNRLYIHLKSLGIEPLVLSMDNYFVCRKNTPLDEFGKPNFESVDAVDLELLNQQLNEIINGEKVELPTYDFVAGERCYRNNCAILPKNGVIIMEGIHCLNPLLSQNIESSQKLKIYVSPLTPLAIDNLTVVRTSDIRLVRRLVRDFNYRNHTAKQTLEGWGSVRRGEERYILPYRNSADEMFDTSLFFEIAILRPHIEPLLHSVSNLYEEHAEAKRVLKLLELFIPINDGSIPPTSIIREFIGGSSFNY